MAGYLFLPEIDAPHRDTGETQPDLSQGLEGSGEPEGELALPENVIRSEGAEVKAPGCHNDFEIEESMESDPGALDEDLQCPREEDVVKMQGGPEFKTCWYVLVHQCKTFRNAQVSDGEATAQGGLGGGEACGTRPSIPYSFRQLFLKAQCASDSPRGLIKT